MAAVEDGIALFNAGRQAEALAVFQGVMRQGRRWPALLFAAHCLEGLGRRRQAIAILESDGRKAAADAALRLREAETRARRATTGAKKSFWNKACDRYRMLARSGRYQEAFAEGAQLMRRRPPEKMLAVFWHPWEPSALETLGAEHKRLLRGRFEGESAAWAKLHLAYLTRRPSVAARTLWPHPWMAGRMGQILLLAGRRKEALPLLRAGSVDPVLGWMAVGFWAEALWLMGRGRQARAVLDNPSWRGRASLRAWRGALSLWEGRYREAIPHLRRAARGKSFWARGWLGAAVIAAGRPSAGLVHLEKALKSYRSDNEARVWKGEALRLLGRPREALAALKGFAQPWAAANRLLALVDLGREREARAEWLRLPAWLKAWAGGRASEREPAPLVRAGLRRARGWRRNIPCPEWFTEK
jgi:tetratricopeptide (TPR) repeat protein